MTFIQRLEYGSLDLTEHPFAWEFGGSFGSSAITYEDVISGVMAGALVSADRRENRTIEISVIISGSDFHEVNDAEKALMAECDKTMNALAFYPDEADDIPPTVFDTFQAGVVFERDDTFEQHRVRRYSLTIPARPFPRSADLTVTPAETDAMDVLVDDGSSTAGWTGSGAISTASGSVVSTYDSAVIGSAQLRLTEAIDTSATKYLQVDWSTSIDSIVDFKTPDARTKLPEVRRDNLGGNLRRSYLLVPDDMTSTPGVRLGAVHPKVAGSATIKVDQIRRLSRLPFSATTRQKISAIYPGGSAPAEGNLHVFHPTSALGRAILYTYPLGRPTPALMVQHLQASETPVPDPTTINGEYIPLTGGQPLVLNVADYSLPTRGLAAIWAKLQVNIATPGDPTLVSIRWTVQPFSNGNLVGPIEEGVITIEPGNTDRVLLPIALVTLPPTVTGIAGSCVITLERVAGVAHIFVDEVWAFGQDEKSALTIVDCGDTTPSAGAAANHLWVKAPTAEAPAGQVLIGTAEENARWPATVQSQQLHKFPPEGVAVLTATTVALDPATELSHHRRWTHHAGD